MCISVAVRDGDLLDSVGELADALGIEPAEFTADGREFCLCNADFARAAKAAGVSVQQAGVTEGWPFPEYIFE